MFWTKKRRRNDDDVMSSLKLYRSEIPSCTGLMLACGALGGEDVGLGDAQVERLRATHTIH